MVPLCVPIRDKDIVKRAGARYNPTDRVWECTSEQLGHPALQPYIPRMYRPGLAGPIIRPWLVPSPLWGINLRALLTKDQWNLIRRDAYMRHGWRCSVCGGKGDKWPVEADEAWDYDDVRCVQTLRGVIALCPRCHQIRHWGSTELKGQTDAAYAHLLRVNRWSEREADDAIEAAFDLWETRSLKTWTSDFAWVGRHYGFEITADGLARADDVHRSFPDPFERQIAPSPPTAPITPARPPAATPRSAPPPLSPPRLGSWSIWSKLGQPFRRPWG